MAYLLKDLSLKTLVTQAAHGFVVGDVLYNNNGTYAKAKADAIGTSHVAGIVEVAATDTFLLVSGGAVTLVGLTAVSQYYLSAATAGAITTTKPSTSGQFIVPVLVSGTSTDAQVFIGAPADAAFGGLLVSSITITQGTITSNVPGIDQSVTWNNAAVSFRGWQLAVTDTASAAASRLISITRSGNDHFVVDNIGRVQMFYHAANTSGGSFTLFKRGTTGDATLAITADTTLGFFGARGWNGTAFHSDASGMQVLSEEAFTGTNGGTRVEIRTVTPGTASNGAFAKFTSSALTLQAGCRLIITRGTLTVDAPSIDITETWNNVAVAFTGIKLNATNTTSSTASLLINLQVDSVSKFSVGRTGFTNITRQEADTNGAGFQLSKRGTTGSATAAVASGDAITLMDSAGWDGTTTATCASIRLFALETFTSIAHGCRFLFLLPDVGGVTTSTRMELRATGLNLSNGCAFSVAHGTITTNLNTILGSVTWNNAAVTFTGISFTVTDTASLAGSLLISVGTSVAAMFRVRKDGLTTISSPGASGAAPTTSQVRLSVGALASPNVVQVQGNSTADNTPAFSIFRSGAREAIFALVGTTLYISNTGGVANHTDTNCSTAPHISLTSSGSFVLTTGTITTAIQTLDSSVTWNSGATTFTAWKLNLVNTTSAAASKLIDIQVSTVSRFAVRASDGQLAIGPAASATAPTVRLVLGPTTQSNALQIHGDTTADNIPVISLSRSGAREVLLGVVGSTFYICSSAGGGTIADTRASTAPFLSLSMLGECQVQSGTQTTAITNFTGGVTWSNAAVAFTGWKLNVTDSASLSSSMLMDLQVGSVSRCNVLRTGSLGLTRQEADTGGVVVLLSKRGTTGSATAAVASGDTIFAINGAGYDGTSSAVDAQILLLATEAHTSTAHGSKFEFHLTATGGVTRLVRMELGPVSLSLLNSCRLIITRGTLTADAPSIDCTETWNNAAVAFTGWKLNITNTTSAATSNIIDLQVGGISKFTQDLTGRTYIQRQVADAAPIIVELRKRGNGAGINNSPASGDNVARLDFRGWDGTSTYNGGAIIQMQAAEAWTSSAAGGRLLFGVAPTGTISSVSYLQLQNVSSDPTFTLLSGTRFVITQGTITTDLKTIDTTVTWNNAAVSFTGWLLNVTNTTSSTASLLMNLLVGGSPKFQVGVNGGVGIGQGFSTSVMLSVTNVSGVTTAARFTHTGATNIVEVQTTSANNVQLSLSANSSAGWNLVAVGSAQEFQLQQQGTGSRLSIDLNGNTKIGTTAAAPTSAVLNLWLNGSTAPSVDPSVGFVQWSGTNEWMYRSAAASEGAGQTNRVHNRAEQVTGAGTDYTLTATTAQVTFGTTSAVATLPTAGTYLVIARVSFIGDAAGAGDSLRAKLRNSTDATDVGSEAQVTMSTNSGREIIILDEVVTVTATKTIQIFGHNATAARGTVESTTTTIKYVRLS